jgi:hypothetical protein
MVIASLLAVINTVPEQTFKRASSNFKGWLIIFPEISTAASTTSA